MRFRKIDITATTEGGREFKVSFDKAEGVFDYNIVTDIFELTVYDDDGISHGWVEDDAKRP